MTDSLIVRQSVPGTVTRISTTHGNAHVRNLGEIPQHILPSISHYYVKTSRSRSHYRSAWTALALWESYTISLEFYNMSPQKAA